MTERVKEIIGMNLASSCIPLVVRADPVRIFPMYYGRIMAETLIAFPVTGATGIDDALQKPVPALASVVDRAGGYEAYSLAGTARYVTSEMDYQLVAEMRSEVPGFPIRGAVVFEVESVHLVAPP